MNDPQNWEPEKSGQAQYEAEVRDTDIAGDSVVFDMDLSIFGWELVYRDYEQEAAEAAAENKMEERGMRAQESRMASRVIERYQQKKQDK